MLEKPGVVNVVAKGTMHRENNDLGNKDKGIPIINTDGVKEYEIEAGEIIFRQKATETIDNYVRKIDEAKASGDKDKEKMLYDEFGSYLMDELLKKTVDNYGKFKVKPKIKEDETEDRKQGIQGSSSEYRTGEETRITGNEITT